MKHQIRHCSQACVALVLGRPDNVKYTRLAPLSSCSCQPKVHRGADDTLSQAYREWKTRISSQAASLYSLFLCETGHVVRCVKEDQGVERMKEDHGVESRACADPKVAMTLRYDFLIPPL